MRYTKRILNGLLTVLQHGILLFFAGIAVLPLISCVLVSFKTQSELVQNPFFNFSGIIHWENYVRVWESGLGQAFLISTVVVITAVLISCLLNAIVAYVLCRFDFKYKKLMYTLLLFASFIPAMTMQVYIFRMMADWNLVNTLHGYILMLCSVDIVPIYIFSIYFSSISKSIDEAAILDGCNYRQVFFRIHVTLLRQAFLTAAIIRSIFVYNEYYLANIYLLDKSKFQTVTTVLNFLSSPFATDYPVICAGVILAILPTVMLFVAFQKRIYNGLSSGKQN